MKKAVLFFSCCTALGLFAAPHFVTPAMIKRQGLTDAQYELLWSKGAHPEVDPSACRAWVFHASRGQNLEEWIGETMGEPELGAKISGTIETNKQLVARNAVLESRHVSDTNALAELHAQYDALGHEKATLVEEVYILKQTIDEGTNYIARLKDENADLSRRLQEMSDRYAAAKPAAAITIRIQTALRDEGTLGPYLRKELVALRNQTTDPKKQEVFDACIELMDSVVNAPRDAEMGATK